MPKGTGVEIDGQKYTLVADHETYVVTDVPSHPDTDARMERRVNHGSWKKGILRRRNDPTLADENIYSVALSNRIEKAGEGVWFSTGMDTRMGDRVFGQRSVGSSTAPGSKPLFMGDGSVFSYVACKQHVYEISGVSAGVQQLTLSKDFSAIVPAVNITDVTTFNGRIYTATTQLTNGVPDAGKAQVMWVWDQTTATTNWTNPPTALPTPTWLAGVQTVLTVAGIGTTNAQISVATTTGMPGGNFNIQIESEILTVNIANGVLLNVVARGVFGTANVSHANGVAAVYNPAVSQAGTGGTTRYQYYIIATGTTSDSIPSLTQTISTGNATLDTTNYNILNWTAVAGATGYKIYRVYSGGTPNTTGIIATGIAGTTYSDQGAVVSSTQYQVTPQFAIGDTGKAIAFTVIRNILWRAAGSKMWSWDGQQGTWSGESVIGDPSTNITALDSYQDGLVIFKQDGIYTMDHGGSVFPIFPGFKTLGLNLRPLGQWQGQYYFASDVGMVWQWDGTSVTSIGFDWAEAYPFPDGTYGLPNAVTRGLSFPNFFLVGFNKWNDSTDNASFFWAWDGTGWHPFHYDPNYQVSGLGLTGGNQTPPTITLQLGKTKANGSSFALSYMTQPTLDPVLINSFDTITQTLFLPVDSGIIADEWKVFEGARVYVENPTTGSIRLFYAIDDDIYTQTFTPIGTPAGDRSSTQVFIPAPELPPYRNLMIKAQVTPDSSGGTPIIRTIMVRYKQRQSQRRAWTMQLFLEESQMKTNRSREHRTSGAMLKALNEARATQRLVVFRDIIGDSYMVYVEEVGESLKTYRNLNFTVSFTAKVVLVEPAELGV